MISAIHKTMNNVLCKSTILFFKLETEQKAHNLMTAFWEWHLQEFPEFATEMGVKGYDDQVTEYTEDAFQRRVVSLTPLEFEFRILFMFKYNVRCEW